MRIAELPIDVDPEKITAFCRDRGIRKLSIFGSALRDDFDTRRSDIDLVVDAIFCKLHEFPRGRATQKVRTKKAWQPLKFPQSLLK